MPIKTARAQWLGDFITGYGTITSGSGAFEASYCRTSVFSGPGGTSPIEVLGASLAGCYAGALAAHLTKDGYTSEHVSANAEVHVEPPEKGYFVSRIHLYVEARVPGMERAAFIGMLDKTTKSCPVAQALGGTEITMDAKLL